MAVFLQNALEETRQRSASGEQRKRSRKGLKDEVVGKRIKVYWADDEAWYAGTIVQFLPEESKHIIIYDDGDREVIQLASEKVKFIKKRQRKELD